MITIIKLFIQLQKKEIMMKTQYESVIRNITVDISQECFISRKISHKQNNVKVGGRCTVNTSKDFACTTVPESHYYKYCSVLFSNNMEKEMRCLRDVLCDLDDYRGIKISPEQFKMVIKSRQILLKETQDKMLRNWMYRNHQIKQGIEQYLFQYRTKIGKHEYINTYNSDQKSSDQGSQSPRKIIPSRPKTSQQISNNKFSKSLMIERSKRGTESELSFRGETLQERHDKRQQRRFSSTSKQINQNHNNNTKINHNDFFNDFLFDENVITHPRPSFLSDNRRQLAAASECKKRTISPTQNQKPQTRLNQVKIIRDKLKLLNSELSIITCTKQQGYKKIYRNPRIFSSIFI